MELLEKKNKRLASKLEMLNRIATSQEESIAESLSNILNKGSTLPCQHCFTLEKEKKDLSDVIVSFEKKVTIQSNEIEIKDKEIINKKKEIDLKEEEIKILNEKIKLLEVKVDFKSNRSGKKKFYFVFDNVTCQVIEQQTMMQTLNNDASSRNFWN